MRKFFLLLSFLLSFSLLAITGVSAQTDQKIRVGVVIQSQGGKINTYCLALLVENNTGLDALEATGLAVNAQRGSLGAQVCKIEQVGCDAPTQACFCQCQGSVCSYWAYSFLGSDNQWKYSSISALSRKLKTGDVDGWLWSENNVTPVPKLPAITFESICKNGLTDTSKTSSIPTTDPLTTAGYIVFALSCSVIGGIVLWRRIRSQ
jgi:hypothetical protein